MAIVKPFKGLRPPKQLIEVVASRPYDVLSSEEARREAEGNEKSLYHIIKPEIDFAPGTDSGSFGYRKYMRQTTFGRLITKSL